MFKPASAKLPEWHEITRLRVAVSERGWWNWGELARRIGCKLQSLSDAIRRNFKEEPELRCKIKVALDYQAAIWSDAETLRLRAKVHEATKLDPMLLPLSELRALARRLGTKPDKQTNSSKHWRGCILIHAAVNKLSPI